MCGPFAWSFWWILPLVGVVLCLGMMLLTARRMGAGHGWMCMSAHRAAPDREAGRTGPDTRH